jgi:ubiquinone/menaquinone biosynthesis C-methylase UbiE
MRLAALVLARAIACVDGIEPRNRNQAEQYSQASGGNRLVTRGLTMAEAQRHYLLERREGEIERLHVQGDALIADTSIMLDRIGVAPGWRCVDLGCGPRGITALLSTRAGRTGRVIGLDADAVFLDLARQYASSRGFGNVEFVTGDVFHTGLPAGSFDLVHTRFVLSNVGNAEGLLEECLRLTRPGGCVALQEADFSTLNCYPSHPAWERLKRALADIVPQTAGDPQFAHGLYRLLRQKGLECVQYRPFVVGFRSSDPMADYLPATMESLGSALREKGWIASELDGAIAECRAHLSEPGTVSTSYTVVQAWGTRRAT